MIYWLSLLNNYDFKSSSSPTNELQEYFQGIGQRLPDFSFLSDGNAHSMKWKALVNLDNIGMIDGDWCTTKSDARNSLSNAVL
jgi:hypothetical protein